MERYKNADLPIEERVEDLLSKMSKEEKIGQLNQVFANLDNTMEIRQMAREGKLGSRILASNAFAGSEVQHVANMTEGNEAQRVAVEESRLGIPIINGRDIIHGYRTVFPIPLAQAASWEPELIEKAAAIAAVEASSMGIHWTFAPMLDIARDPRWGRIIEGFGEDPYLCSQMAKAAVKGFQGDDTRPEGRLVACAKHFIAYGGAEGGRDYNTCECTDNTLRNVYLPPFKAAVEAGVGTVMSGFHEIGGEPVSGSHYLLTQVLKQELGFDGFVISDWGSVEQLIHHGVAENRAEAAARAFHAGVDMDMADACYIEQLDSLLESGVITGERLDDAVRRILRIKFRAGLFENPYTDPTVSEKVILAEEHLNCAKEAAVKSMVLLENKNNMLPLPTNGKKIAVIGPLAEAKRQIMGSWVMDGHPEDVVSFLEGMKQAAPQCEFITSSALTDEMLIAVRQADIVVLALGESNYRNGEGANLTDLNLPEGQLELLKAIRRFHKPVVTVVFSGRPLNMSEVSDLCDALLYAWHPGIQGGVAAAELLFGIRNPSGKLPVTFPRNVGQIPIYYNHKRNGHDIDEYYAISSRIHYYDQSGSPLYPFGFGLSYTHFDYSKIEVGHQTLCSEDVITVSCEVTNTGNRDGDEIVQLYIQDQVASTTRPVRELKGFKRIHLSAGATKTVSFTLGRNELSFYDHKGVFTLEPGTFSVWIGGNCLTENKESFIVRR